MSRSTKCGAARRQEPLPTDEAISDLDDAEDALAERLDGSHYRDDILRLLFICCHPDLPATQQIALALRIVSGLSVKQIARAFLVSEAAMEQRITRAKARVAEAGVPFETPGAVERSERLAAVAAMIYLIFNEGYSASGDTAELRSAAVRGGDPAGAAAAAAVPERAGDHGPDRAAAAAARARAPRASTRMARWCCWTIRTARCGIRSMIAEGLALIDKAMRHRASGPYQIQAAIAALHARAATPEETDWLQIDLLYGALEVDAAVAGGHAQPRGRGVESARAAKPRSR